jgi:hypothetical protein
MKENLVFFTHDRDAHHHPKMRALRAKYGNGGYGAFWILNELIASSSLGLLDLSKSLNRMATAEDLRMTPDEFDGFLSFLEAVELIQSEGGVVTTDRVQEDLGRVIPEREKARDRTKKRRGMKSSPEHLKSSPEHLNCSPEQINRGDRGEERRVEENRGEESTHIESVRFPGNYPKVIFDAWTDLGPVALQPPSLIHWLNSTWREIEGGLRGVHSDEVLAALANFKTITTSGKSWWKSKPSPRDFFAKHLTRFLPANFDEASYFDSWNADTEDADDIASRIDRAIEAARAESL